MSCYHHMHACLHEHHFSSCCMSTSTEKDSIARSIILLTWGLSTLLIMAAMSGCKMAAFSPQLDTSPECWQAKCELLQEYSGRGKRMIGPGRKSLSGGRLLAEVSCPVCAWCAMLRHLGTSLPPVQRGTCMHALCCSNTAHVQYQQFLQALSLVCSADFMMSPTPLDELSAGT